MPTLISPVDDLRDAFVAMATEFADQGEPRYMVEAKDFSAYLAALRERERGDGLPAGWVSDSHFWLVHEARILGDSRLRHRLTPALQREGGHIGYVTCVRVTCDADNSPSVRVIEKNGGVLDGEAVSARSGKVIRQYWIERAVPAAQPCIAADEASPGP
jgi:predicted acetyltransferase